MADKKKASKKAKKPRKGDDSSREGGDDRRSSSRKRWAAEGREFSRAIGLAVAIAFLLRFFVIEAFKIPSGSMLPTLEVGDHIFVNKFIYGFMIPLTTRKVFQLSEPEPGDVIVFKYPRDTGQDYIKRVVATPGDELEVIRGNVYINGMEYRQEDDTGQGEVIEQDCRIGRGTVKREQIGGASHLIFDSGRGANDDYGPVKIPKDHVFVMGDNRDHSSDSRDWGYVPYGHIKGKALFVWLSWNKCANEKCQSSSGDCGTVVRWSRLFSGVE